MCMEMFFEKGKRIQLHVATLWYVGVVVCSLVINGF